MSKKQEPAKLVALAGGVKNTLKRAAVVQDARDVVLGEEYTDSVTGIRGVAIIVYVHLTGCDQVALSYLKDSEQKFITVDATRLTELQGSKVARRAGAGPSDVPTKVPQ